MPMAVSAVPRRRVRRWHAAPAFAAECLAVLCPAGAGAFAPTQWRPARAENESAVAVHGKLRVHGSLILDESNRPVRLRGVCLFWSQLMPEFWNADAVRWLQQDWRATLVRASMGIEPRGYLEHPAREKAKVRAVVDASIAVGIYVVIDWHDYNADSHLDEASAFFEEMARDYGGHPNVLFETFNEPMEQGWEDTIRPYHEAIVHIIRRYTDNIIILGTRHWSQEVEEASMSPLDGVNLAYALHFYAASNGYFLREKAKRAMSNGVALFVTAWGTSQRDADLAETQGASSYPNLGETQAWLDFLGEHHISDANWALSDKALSDKAAPYSSGELKHGASGTGGWQASQLTMSGIFVRTSIREHHESAVGLRPNSHGLPAAPPWAATSSGEDDGVRQDYSALLTGYFDGGLAALQRSPHQGWISTTAVLVGGFAVWDGLRFFRVLSTITIAAAAASIADYELRIWGVARNPVYEVVVVVQVVIAVAAAAIYSSDGFQVLLGALIGGLALDTCCAWMRVAREPAVICDSAGAILGVFVFTAWRQMAVAVLTPLTGSFFVVSGLGVLVGLRGCVVPMLPPPGVDWVTAAAALLGGVGSQVVLVGVWVCTLVAMVLQRFGGERRQLLIVSSLVACVCVTIVLALCSQGLEGGKWQWSVFGGAVWAVGTAATAWRQVGMLRSWQVCTLQRNMESMLQAVESSLVPGQLRQASVRNHSRDRELFMLEVGGSEAASLIGQEQSRSSSRASACSAPLPLPPPSAAPSSVTTSPHSSLCTSPRHGTPPPLSPPGSPRRDCQDRGDRHPGWKPMEWLLGWGGNWLGHHWQALPDLHGSDGDSAPRRGRPGTHRGREVLNL